MKIVEHTERYLELANQNRRCLWGLLFATPFVVIGSIATALTVKVTTLTCQRAPGNQIDCQRTIAGILGTERELIPGNLKSVKTVKTSGTGVVLGTSQGEVNLAPYKAFVTDSQYRTADRLNAFLKNPQQQTISVEQDDRWINFLWSGNFIVGGLVIGLYSLQIPLQMSCKFQHDLDRVTIDKKYLLYGDRKTVLPLSTIKQAQVRELLFSISGDRQPLYTIDLATTDAKQVSLSVSSKNLTECQRLVNIVDRFVRQHQSSLDRTS
ncbi:hypothetical protein [Chamaesiphon minutus]|uniref:Uncharacterized protein n=1 Tax=Chamaesiphon minutus (strain ATCC 27169 / PCC 6605) TaxID=1173020 RepID=K9UCV2_CHAP6|nr:hypothetical protein [Chamaesiphon minutus]AFY92039.1 hypothetical protein Cha6605_0771 [Chamaesiphon minutus PCC 6605]